MSAPSLFRISKAICQASVWLSLSACADSAQPVSTWSQAEILKRYSSISAEDRSIAQSMAEQARKRMGADPSAVQNNAGPLLKLWCEAAMIAPNPENLAECARFHFAAVEQMSNPQPSKDAVRLQYAKDALAMVKSAAQITSDSKNVEPGVLQQLEKEAATYQEIISKGEGG